MTSDSFLSTKSLIFIGGGLIAVSLFFMIDLDDIQNENLDIIYEDITSGKQLGIQLPVIKQTTEPIQNQVVTAAQKVTLPQQLQVSATLWHGNICSSGASCLNEKTIIQSYTSDDCDEMIMKWKAYPDWVLRPLLAVKILQVCYR